tara:strand:+ start:2221 stop:2337 length:117 start_codon:yes stop_codon:yes gene_type:complete
VFEEVVFLDRLDEVVDVGIHVVVVSETHSLHFIRIVEL